MKALALLCALVTLVLPLRASAQPAHVPEAGDRWQAPFAVLGHVGVGTPVGFIGAGAEYAPVRNFVLEAGAGLGGAGVQAAGMLRLRVPFSASTAVGLGAGASVGNYEWREGFVFDKPAAKRAEPGYFGNLAVIVEHRFGSAERGFQLRELVGAALLLNRDDLECSEEIDHCLADHSDEGGRVPFFGMSFGYYL